MIREIVWYDALCDIIKLRHDVMFVGKDGERRHVMTDLTLPADEKGREEVRYRSRCLLGQRVGRCKVLPLPDPYGWMPNQPDWVRQDLMPVIPFNWAGKATRGPR